MDLQRGPAGSFRVPSDEPPRFALKASGLPVSTEKIIDTGLPAQATDANHGKATERAWKEHLKKLRKTDIEHFTSHKQNDLVSYIDTITRACERQSKESKAFRINEWFRPLFQAMDIYMPIAVAASQAYPNPSALILGGISYVMQVSSNFGAYQERIALTLASMGFKAALLIDYEEQIFRQDEKIELRLVRVYGHMLDFCRECSGLLVTAKGKRKSSLVTLSLSLWKPFDTKFGKIIQAFEIDIDQIEQLALLQQRILDQQERDQGKQDRSQAQVERQILVQASAQASVQTENLGRGLFAVGESINRHFVQQYRWMFQEQAAKELAEAARMKNEIINWIPHSNYDQHFFNLCEKHLEGTGQWLLESPAYTTWKEQDTSAVLWITGKAGSGKSVLAALAIDDLGLAKEPGDVAVAYVFCKSAEETARKSGFLVGSLIRQFLQQSTSIDPFIEDMYEARNASQSSDLEWHRAMKALGSLVDSLPETYIVVDGLDECEDQLRLTSLIAALSRSFSSTVKILIFSRPEYVELEKPFSQYVKMLIDTGANKEDIRRYISSIVSEDNIAVGSNKVLLAKVQKTLLDSSDGMFLWVFLMVQSLQEQSTPRQVEQTLEAVPKGLDEIYVVSLKRIAKQPEEFKRTTALRIILFMLVALRPLSSQELFEAMAVKPDMKVLDHDDIVPNARGWIANCADLVSLDAEDNFVFIHSSLRESLETLKTDQEIDLAEFSQLRSAAKELMAETCLRYLLLENFNSGAANNAQELTKLLKKNDFLGYAATNWNNYIHPGSPDNIRKLVLRVANTPSARELTLQVMCLSRDLPAVPFSGLSTPLHLIAFCGLVEYSTELHDIQSMLDKQDGHGRTPLDYALIGRNPEMCLWILKQKLRYPQVGDLDGKYSPLHAAAFRGWTEVVLALIAQGYEVDAVNTRSGETPLLAAASEGHLEALQALLDAGADPTKADTDGDNALLYAASGGYRDLWVPLLDAGCDINAARKDGATALHLAINGGDAEGIDLLLRRGADIRSQAVGLSNQTALHFAAESDRAEIVTIYLKQHLDLNVKDDQNWTPLHIAAYHGSLATAKRLLAEGVDVRAVDDVGCTALHRAAEMGKVELVKELLAHCHDTEFVNAVDVDGDMAIHAAAIEGTLEIVELLLDNNAKVDERNRLTGEHTPLLLAVLKENFEAAKLLINRKADPTARGVLNSPPLHYAANNGSHEFIQILLDAGADVNATNETKETALHFAITRGYETFARKLLEARPDLDVNVEDKWGQTPLHGAAGKGFLPLVQLLVEKNAVVRQDKTGDLPMHLAAWSGCGQVLKLFVNKDNIKTPGSDERTMMFAAVSKGNFKLVEWLFVAGAEVFCRDTNGRLAHFSALAKKSYNVVDFLLDNGLNPHATDLCGATMLHVAAEVGAVDIGRRLLDMKCTPDVKNVWGRTPFHTAVQHEKLEFIDLLLANDINGSKDTDRTGMSTLHSASYTGNFKLLDKLLKLGADLHASDHLHRNAVHYAALGGQAEIIVFLKSVDVPVDQRSVSQQSPLLFAASERYVNAFKELLFSDPRPDINAMTSDLRLTPLLEAASSQAIEILEMLVQAGAEKDQRNLLGMNASDYAFLHPMTKEKMESLACLGDAPNPETCRERCMTAANAAISGLLKSSEGPEAVREYQRVSWMLVLVVALTSLGDDASRENVFPAITELAFPPETAYYSTNFKCGSCGRRPFEMDSHVCVTCYLSSFLCDKCYKAMREEKDSSEGTFAGFNAIEDLEQSLKPLRRGLQTIDPDSLLLVAWALDHFQKMSDWLDEKWAEYEAWQATFNSGGYFSRTDRPGLDLLKIIRETLTFIKESPPGEPFTDEEGIVYKDLKTRFDDLQKKHKGDQEWYAFCCSEHTWFSVPLSERDKVKKESTVIDKHGYVTRQWLERLQAHYRTQGRTELTRDDVQTHDVKTTNTMISWDLSRPTRSEQTHQMMAKRASLRRVNSLPPIFESGSWTVREKPGNMTIARTANLVASEVARRPRRANTEPLPTRNFERVEVETKKRTGLISSSEGGTVESANSPLARASESESNQAIRKSLGVMTWPQEANENETARSWSLISPITRKDSLLPQRSDSTNADTLTLSTVDSAQFMDSNLMEDPEEIEETKDGPTTSADIEREEKLIMGGGQSEGSKTAQMEWTFEVDVTDANADWDTDSEASNAQEESDDGRTSQKKTFHMRVEYHPTDVDEVVTVLALRLTDSVFPGFSQRYFRYRKWKTDFEKLVAELTEDLAKESEVPVVPTTTQRLRTYAEKIPVQVAYGGLGIFVVAGSFLMWRLIARRVGKA